MGSVGGANVAQQAIKAGLVDEGGIDFVNQPCSEWASGSSTVSATGRSN